MACAAVDASEDQSGTGPRSALPGGYRTSVDWHLGLNVRLQLPVLFDLDVFRGQRAPALELGTEK